ncbi:MotA/TolQ/ExbB proton channel family protein, partial [Variovorax sp. GB1P17]
MKSLLARLFASVVPLVLAFCLAGASHAADAPSGAAPTTQDTGTAASVAAPVAVPAPVLPAATTKVDNPYGIGALWAQSDLVAKAVLAILAIMSMGSWY